MFSKRIVVIILLLLGFLLRFIKVDYAPPGLTMDEAAIGYNAYSILMTGKDEYGKAFPLAFRSFADYKTPVYSYLAVPPIWAWGLKVMSLRFPSMVLGTLTGFLIYLFILEFLGKTRWLLAVLSMAVYLFSGWSILYSRGAFEANVALFFLILGIYLQLLAFRKNHRWLLFLSVVSYSLSVYSYHSEKILALLFLPVLSIFFKNLDKKGSLDRKTIIICFLAFLLLSSPQYLFFKQTAGNTRIRNTAIIKEEEIREAFREPAKAIFLIERQLSLYFAYFSPRNLFFDPDSMKTRTIPEVSTFYPWMVIPYLIGLYCLFSLQNKEQKRSLAYILLISPIPAAFTGDPFATLRALHLIFPLSIIIGLGMEKIINYWVKGWYLLPISLVIVVISFLQLCRGLFWLLPYEKYLDWNYGYSALVENINKFPDLEVLFNDTVGDNYPEFLFFQRYPPAVFQKEQNKINLAKYYEESGWISTFHFGRIKVMPLIWKRDVYTKQLIVATPLAISEDQAEEHFLSKAFAIIGPDGKEVFNGYLTNPELKMKDDERKLKLKKYESGDF